MPTLMADRAKILAVIPIRNQQQKLDIRRPAPWRSRCSGLGGHPKPQRRFLLRHFSALLALLPTGTGVGSCI